MSNEGKKTSEAKQSTLVILLSTLLPAAALVLDNLVGNGVINGTWAMVAGLVSAGIASAGYSYSRGKVKAAEAIADMAKKKS
jgi:hypothetical protein